MIHKGMSEEEVIRILNTKSSDRVELTTLVTDKGRDTHRYGRTFEFYSPFGGGISAFVVFDEQAYVEHIQLEKTYPSNTAYYLSRALGF